MCGSSMTQLYTIQVAIVGGHNSWRNSSGLCIVKALHKLLCRLALALVTDLFHVFYVEFNDLLQCKP